VLQNRVPITLSSPSSMAASSARMTGRPTIAGNVNLGRLSPAMPHFTNWYTIQSVMRLRNDQKLVN
jgi:hypothetical protein